MDGNVQQPSRDYLKSQDKTVSGKFTTIECTQQIALFQRYQVALPGPLLVLIACCERVLHFGRESESGRAREKQYHC
jgi:hypothetical protein